MDFFPYIKFIVGVRRRLFEGPAPFRCWKVLGSCMPLTICPASLFLGPISFYWLALFRHLCSLRYPHVSVSGLYSDMFFLLAVFSRAFARQLIRSMAISKRSTHPCHRRLSMWTPSRVLLSGVRSGSVPSSPMCDPCVLQFAQLLACAWPLRGDSSLLQPFLLNFRVVSPPSSCKRGAQGVPPRCRIQVFHTKLKYQRADGALARGPGLETSGDHTGPLHARAHTGPDSGHIRHNA